MVQNKLNKKVLIYFIFWLSLIQSCSVKIDKTKFKTTEAEIELQRSGKGALIFSSYFVNGVEYENISGHSIRGLQKGEKFLIWYDPSGPEISRIDFSNFILDTTRTYKSTYGVITHCSKNCSCITFVYEIDNITNHREQYIDTALYMKLDFYKKKIIPIIYDELETSIAYYLRSQ